MKNGEANAQFGIVCSKWELFLFFPFSIFHSPLLTLRVFVSSWQEQRERYGLTRVGLMIVLWVEEVRVSCLSPK